MLEVSSVHTYTCIVAEDEALLRAELVAQLALAWPALRVVAACDDGGAALEALAAHRPDVAFLDIRMPGLSGLEVASAMADVSPHTQVVFVTAYDQYAIDAFDRGALDYLLKPVVPARLAATLRRLRTRADAGRGPLSAQTQAQAQQAQAAAVAELLRRLGPGLPDAPRAPPLVWLTASSGSETRLIMVDDIVYFQSDTKYTVVMTAQGEALLRKTVRELLEVLDPAIFRQIHRSTIVNMKAVASVTRDDAGRGVMRLKTRPETLLVSQPFMALFRNM